MEVVRQYILSVVCAGILCGILKALTGKTGTLGVQTSVMCGIFLSLTIVRPLVTLDLGSLLHSLDSMAPDSAAVVQEGTQLASREYSAIISRQCRAYILDKARALSLEVDAEVVLSDDAVPVPVSVTVMGPISPYGRERLSEILSEDLGIGKEAQYWVE